MRDVFIEFFYGKKDDPILSAHWPVAPSAGDFITIKGVRYRIAEVSWGCHVGGTETGDIELWDEPAVAVELKKVGVS